MNKAASKKIDMTTGPIMKNVLLFAIPIIIGNILQQLYTTVDTLIIGNFCKYTSLAAVGTSSQPVEVLLCLFLGIGSGVSILTSQFIGAKKMDKLKDLCSTAISFVFMCGVPLTVIGWFAAPLLLKFMGVPADTWNPALNYTRMVLLGTLGNIGYNMNAGMLRGMGDSRASLFFLVISCITNISLDFVFVAGLSMDTTGAALATAIAQLVSWIVSIVYIRKKFPELGYTFLPKRFVGKVMKEMLSIGVPMGLNSALYSFGHMALQTLVNAQGSVFMAGISVAGKVTGIANIAITGFSQAASTFSGQNYGAKNYRRLKQGHWMIPLISSGITLTFGLIVISIRMPILHWFNREADVIFYASRFVVVSLLSQWIYTLFNCIMTIVNGTGNVKYSMAVNLIMLWVVRVPTAYIIDKFFDGTWIMLCYPISFTFAAICMVSYYFFSPKWKAIMKAAQEQEMPAQ